MTKNIQKSLIFCACLALGGLCLNAAGALAAESASPRISLVKPRTSGGKSLLESLALRKTTRVFADKPIPDQNLSELLWATWGVNRPDGRHTAPTSMNSQSVQVYVAMQNGVWLYDPKKHELTQALAEDMRAAFGGAPLTLIYAADENSYASGMHVGSLYQNAGLYCASAGLGNVVKKNGVSALDGRLKLPVDYKVFIVQSVGWPH